MPYTGPRLSGGGLPGRAPGDGGVNPGGEAGTVGVRLMPGEGGGVPHPPGGAQGAATAPAGTREAGVWRATSWTVEGSRLAHSTQSSGSRENSSYERSRLSIQASSSWAVEGDQDQTVARCDKERSGKLTLWLRSRGAGDRNGQGIDGDSPNDEEGENSFEEHDDVSCREEEQMITAPGLRFGR